VEQSVADETEVFPADVTVGGFAVPHFLGKPAEVIFPSHVFGVFSEHDRDIVGQRKAFSAS
jgi:hypothetical protein